MKKTILTIYYKLAVHDQTMYCISIAREFSIVCGKRNLSLLHIEKKIIILILLNIKYQVGNHNVGHQFLKYKNGRF